MKILMVCLGNICRSPLAEGILKSKVDTTKITVESAGTGSSHIGQQPDKRSRAIAKKHQISIDDQVARKFTVADFDAFDLIYAMDGANYRNIIRLARNEADKQKVKLILNELFEGENLDIPDPYYGGEMGFQTVYKMLNEACFVIANNLHTDDER